MAVVAETKIVHMPPLLQTPPSQMPPLQTPRKLPLPSQMSPLQTPRRLPPPSQMPPLQTPQRLPPPSQMPPLHRGGASGGAASSTSTTHTRLPAQARVPVGRRIAYVHFPKAGSQFIDTLLHYANPKLPREVVGSVALTLENYTLSRWFAGAFWEKDGKIGMGQQGRTHTSRRAQSSGHLRRPCSCPCFACAHVLQATTTPLIKP